jgi:hypothetical protein
VNLEIHDVSEDVSKGLYPLLKKPGEFYPYCVETYRDTNREQKFYKRKAKCKRSSPQWNCVIEDSGKLL